MPPRAELQPLLAESPRQRRQRLPLLVPPIASETLDSYLARITDRNLLRPGWLPQLSRSPHFLADLTELTGLTERALVSALPELRTPKTLVRWPHLAGQVSKRAGMRPACTHCVGARTGGHAPGVTVFASHDNVLCPVHQRWTGSPELNCASHEQFSIRACSEIAVANLKHRRLINQCGRDTTYSCFTAAVTCFSTWSGWPAISRVPDIKQRKKQLGIRDETHPLTPRQIAAWYPNTVALTEIIIALRHKIETRRSSKAAAVAQGLAQLENLVPGLSPSGASDPFRRAILTELHTPPSEVEVTQDHQPSHIPYHRKDHHGTNKAKL